MINNENNTNTNTNTNADETTNNTLRMKDLRGWCRRIEDLSEFIAEMGNSSVESFCINGVRKSGKAQALAVLLHCSSGYIGDKFRDKKTTSEQVDVVAELIAPAMTPEEIKARNLATAENALEQLMEAGVAADTIKLVVGAMPEGLRALEEAGI